MTLGEVTALAIIADMPELEALADGLAPVDRQSGNRRARASCEESRGSRQARYMAALVALRFNQPLKAKYQDVRAGGKPAKFAISAIMRKLVVLTNPLMTDHPEMVSIPS
ncbi:transposase [Mesorhizobium sp. M0895]|uniref:transposase n=1 Tax=Mesorhizobium sp. M0895 TaxID=2957019 RepID=UPI003336ED9C